MASMCHRTRNDMFPHYQLAVVASVLGHVRSLCIALDFLSGVCSAVRDSSLSRRYASMARAAYRCNYL